MYKYNKNKDVANQGVTTSIKDYRHQDGLSI